jgi:hypothetical protein
LHDRDKSARPACPTGAPVAWLGVSPRMGVVSGRMLHRSN